jgi:uracil-DNA glycosylase
LDIFVAAIVERVAGRSQAFSGKIGVIRVTPIYNPKAVKKNPQKNEDKSGEEKLRKHRYGL